MQILLKVYGLLTVVWPLSEAGRSIASDLIPHMFSGLRLQRTLSGTINMNKR